MTVPLGSLIAAGVAGGYILTSVLLLKFPLLIHKKKKLKFRCRHISHRGGAGENLENTLTAFRHAVACGTEMLELDVQLTADKQVVVSHDNHLLRATGDDIHCHELSYENLPLLQSSVGVTFIPGLVCEAKDGDRRIPLLREVFKEFPNIPINLDVKEDNDELIDKVHELICEYNRKEITAWGNFRESINTKLYRKEPTIPLLMSKEAIIRVVLAFYAGILPYIEVKESLMEIPDLFATRVVERRYQWIVQFMSWLLLSPVLIRHLERRGIQTYLWVLNEEKDFDYAFEKLGVAGVMTDLPTKLQEYLQKHPSEGSLTPLVEN